MDIAPITAGMNSAGCDRGPGSDAEFAHLDDVWTAEAKRGPRALVEVALRADHEQRITALRALSTLSSVARSEVEPLMDLARTRGPIVKCERINDASGVYRLRFSLSTEARKAIATFAARDDRDTVLQWLLEGADHAVCGSDTVAQPRVVFARALARLDRELALPWGDRIARALFENQLYEHERNALFVAVREENPRAFDALIEGALRLAPPNSLAEVQRFARR